ncbi:Mitogen-activated protein kinase kinase kinase [Trema orientale]|uniref:non-specific serine/threonine protein kinase n=1 Tax=Trema orientale TaxID=63057 RepID=A0A2P5DZI0_TREOI|nr:Mitogen-activated protein kinase kinase kinase [Trema orientale]
MFRTMVQRALVFLLLAFIQSLLVAGETDSQDYNALMSLMRRWDKLSFDWEGQDPCGENWEGIWCSGSRVTEIILPSMNLAGSISDNIQQLSELRTLDLSYNKDLGGMLPSSIGNLKKLENLALIGCSFYGPIPDSIGNLQQLTFLSLNSNNFSGRIPNSIGYLSNLHWLDLSENQLEGSIPVSNGTIPSLDMLVGAKHFHLGNNKLSGNIPSQLFSSNMTLLHLLLDSNKLVGKIPDTIGLVQTLVVLRLDRNILIGALPSNITNLTNVNELLLSNNKLSGPVPNLTSMNFLTYVDISNNSFDASAFPTWFSTLQSLTTIKMENTQLQGPVPASLFSLPNLETVVLRDNQLNGTLNIGTSYSSNLQLVDLQNNLISEAPRVIEDNISLILVGNPVCLETGVTKSYCIVPDSDTSYSVPLVNCQPNLCSSGQASSPRCSCAYPYKGTFIFRSVSFSDLSNSSYFMALEEGLISSFKSNNLPVDSVSVSNPTMDSLAYLNVSIEIFASGEDRFNQTGITGIAFLLSNQIFKAPEFYGPYAFIGDNYVNFAVAPEQSKSSSRGIITGAAVGGSFLLLFLLIAGVYAYRQKERAKRAVGSNPFVQWDQNKSHGAVPQLKGARWFSFEELKMYTNNFSEINEIGSGGYGKVYRGILPAGQLIAIKRAQRESMQGGPEFKTEIELLSRVHHKNLVSLVGFCFDQGEQMLVYEYVPNGTLRDTLSGKSGIWLEWIKRLEISLGAARGIAYLHEFANPPIIHRDIKTTNILLDMHLTAKVADFGLSKIMGDNEKGHVSTQVKGTVGYLDPDYYMTQQLTEKSDVYSFGVVMLEIITGRKPIEQGKYIVREVRMAMDKTKELYNLGEILDQAISFGTTLKGLEKYVDLALRCVEESGAERPTMGEVVKEIENIMQIAGVNPTTESRSTSETSEDASMRHRPCNTEVFPYNGDFPHPR